MFSALDLRSEGVWVCVLVIRSSLSRFSHGVGGREVGRDCTEVFICKELNPDRNNKRFCKCNPLITLRFNCKMLFLGILVES